MKCAHERRQRGATLLVGMIMMVVLTLLVVLALRSGNTNLRIAGNMQSQTEATAAVQQVIEQQIELIKVTTDPSMIAAQSVPVVMGNVTYTVAVAAMSTCRMEVPVLNADLNPNNPNDVACFEDPDRDQLYGPDGTPNVKPSACKTQQWDVEVSATDGASGAKVTHVQGISIRVPTAVTCL